jgi:hypothetical protein
MQSSAAALSGADGEGKTADNMSLTIFTIVVDHNPWSYRRKLVTVGIGKAAYRGGA